MTFNTNQKILTIAYCILLIVILCFLTPYYYHIESDYIWYEKVGFANFFTTNPIAYPKLFIEIGILSIVYFLILIILKTKIK